MARVKEVDPIYSITRITVSDLVLEQEQVGDSSTHINSKRTWIAASIGVLQMANDTVPYLNVAEPSARGGGASGGVDKDEIAVFLA